MTNLIVDAQHRTPDAEQVAAATTRALVARCDCSAADVASEFLRRDLDRNNDGLTDAGVGYGGDGGQPTPGQLASAAAGAARQGQQT